MISYYRVDERVIHGQTLTVVTRQVPCDALIIVDDQIADDSALKGIFKGMTNYKVLVFHVDAAVHKLPEAEKSSKNYFVIFKHPTALAELIQKGYQISLDKIMIGPQMPREETITYFPTMCLTAEEAQALDKIASTGVTILMQSILAEKPVTWQEAKRNVSEK